MQVSKLKAAPREAFGKHHLRRLRRTGKVPGVVYGGSAKPEHVEMDFVDVDRELRKHHRVFRLDLGGKTEAVYIQDIHFNCLTDEALHIDFLRIDIREPLEVAVELQFIGHPKGASKGGVLVKDVLSIPVRALPLAIPYEIPVPIAELDVGDAVLAGQLQLPEGVTLDCPPETQICHLPAS